MKHFSMKENKGITIVALVVTIIVLLILATITLRTISDDGMIDTAIDTKEET